MLGYKIKSHFSLKLYSFHRSKKFSSSRSLVYVVPNSSNLHSRKFLWKSIAINTVSVPIYAASNYCFLAAFSMPAHSVFVTHRCRNGFRSRRCRAMTRFPDLGALFCAPPSPSPGIRPIPSQAVPPCPMAERSGRGSQPQNDKTQRDLRCVAKSLF